MKTISDRRTGVFANVFDVDFFIFSINQAFSLVSRSSFLLKRRVKEEPEKPNALVVQTSPSREKLIVFS